ncbi:MAG: protein kinase [Myxococcota bacterium]
MNAAIGGRYRIARRLGAGGMARVYLCWDERLHLWCAIKVMTDDAVLESMMRARFVQEARTLARLGHANLVRLFDLVDHVESPYMVMEYVEGGTVAARLARGPLHLHQAMVLGAELCSALEAAHAAGVVHRDVKPQNLLLDAAGQLKVSDFGVARVEQELRLTVSNMSLGTLAYMPPEQQRDASKVDHRADIYAAGATLYALVTQRRPTSLLTADRDRALEVLPAEVRPIVRRATEPGRRDRYESAQVMEDALREAIDRVPMPPGLPPIADRAEPPPASPPRDDIALEPGELDGTERPYRPSTLDRGGARTPPPITLRPPFQLAFSAIDPSSDAGPPPAAEPVRARRPGRSGSVWLGLAVLLLGIACGGACAGVGVLAAGGLGTALVWPP